MLTKIGNFSLQLSVKDMIYSRYIFDNIFPLKLKFIIFITLEEGVVGQATFLKENTLLPKISSI